MNLQQILIGAVATAAAGWVTHQVVKQLGLPAAATPIVAPVVSLVVGKFVTDQLR
jgi:hypothetical protein